MLRSILIRPSGMPAALVTASSSRRRRIPSDAFSWGEFFAALSDTGYSGPVCIEVEDRAYEGSLDDRKRALRQSRKFLEQFMG